MERLYDYANNDPVNLIDPSGRQGQQPQPVGFGTKVKVTRVSRPVEARPFCGGVDFMVSFSLDPNPGVRGVILQKVNFSFRQNLLCCNADEQDPPCQTFGSMGIFNINAVQSQTYWEAWKVDKNGNVTPREVAFMSFDTGEVAYFNDRFRLCNVLNSCGQVTISGELAFFAQRSFKTLLTRHGWSVGPIAPPGICGVVSKQCTIPVFIPNAHPAGTLPQWN